MSKTFYCIHCNVELNEENSYKQGFFPCCKSCKNKKSLKDFSFLVGNILNEHKGFDVGFYSDSDTEKVIVIYKGERFTLKVER